MTFKAHFSSGVNWLAQRRLLGIAILGLGLLLATAVIMTGPEAEPTTAAEKAWPVSVTVVEPRSLSPSLMAFGRVESRRVANLKTSVGAVVAEVLTPEGSEVKAGDLLVRMERDELSLAVRRAEADYKQRLAALSAVRNRFDSARRTTEHHRELKRIAEAKLERYRELFATKMISSEILDEVQRQASERAIALEEHRSSLANFPSLIEQHEATVAEAEAALEVARLDLAQTELRAPFDGRIMATDVGAGDRIVPGNMLVRIADYDHLEVRAAIPPEVGASLRRRLDAGLPVKARGHVDGEAIELALRRLAGDVKPGHGGLDAFFAPVSGGHLDIGRVIDLTITLPAVDNVVAVPVQSIYEDDRIYKVVDSRLVGIEADRMGDYIDQQGNFKVLVRSDELSTGDRVITTQLPRAISGMLVDPIDEALFDGVIAAQPETTDGSS